MAMTTQELPARVKAESIDWKVHTTGSKPAGAVLTVDVRELNEYTEAWMAAGLAVTSVR